VASDLSSPHNLIFVLLLFFEQNGGTPTIVIPNAPMEIIEEVHVVPMAMSPDW
jgi:hypothetical protein